jgi:hypothetical protein
MIIQSSRRNPSPPPAGGLEPQGVTLAPGSAATLQLAQAMSEAVLSREPSGYDFEVGE